MPLSGGAGDIAVGVAAYNDANIAVATGVWQALTFNQERRDDSGFHSVVTNTSRLTVPDGLSGWYSIAGEFAFAASGLGTFRFGSIRLNGVTYIGLYFAPFYAAFNAQVLLSTPYYLSDNGAAANDYVELCALHDIGVNLNVLAIVAYSPEFRMIRV